MYIRQITIKNYKAIKEISFRLDKPLIPIVGVNEAGKSTIIEAILAFMPDNDRLNDGYHLNPANIYSNSSDAEIMAEIKFESRQEILDLRTERSANIISNLDSLYRRDEEDTFTITRYLPSNEYYFVSPLSEQHFERGLYTNTEFIKRVLDRLPRFSYFEDFITDVPPKIVFTRIQNTSDNEAKLEQYDTVWQSIIEEIFERSGIGFPRYLARVEQQEDPSYQQWKTHSEDLEVVNIQLNQRLAEEWINIAGGENSRLKNAIPYKFKLEHPSPQKEIIKSEENEEIQYHHVMRFRLEDRLSEDQPAPFNVAQRSKGYQWFCNFVLRLEFNPEYRDDRQKALFLLDEPGAYLHPLAQERLLDKLVAISRSNSIVYTTHFPQLVDPSKIKLHDCLVAFRKGNEITLSSYGQMDDTQSYGALTTLHNAMKLSLPGIMFPNSPIPFAITEGITEFYVFKMVKDYTSLFNDCEMSIVPGSGVDQLQALISLAIAWSDPYVVIFDKDPAANKAIGRYVRSFGEEQKSRYWIQIENVGQDEKVALEGLFSEGDKERLENLTDGSIKRAFEILYYSDEATKQAFWDAIEEETKNNFEWVAEKIKAIVTPQN